MMWFVDKIFYFLPEVWRLPFFIGGLFTAVVIFGFLLVKKIFRTEKNLNAHITGYNQLAGRLNPILMFLESKFYGKSQSPIRLKDEYKTLLEQSELKQKIDDLIPSVKEGVQTKNPKTPLDAQTEIRTAVEKMVTDNNPDMTDFKKLLYKSGELDVSLTPIISLYLFEKIIPELDFDVK